jgi:hypothetical protein
LGSPPQPFPCRHTLATTSFGCYRQKAHCNSC